MKRAVVVLALLSVLVPVVASAASDACEMMTFFGGHSKYWNIWCLWDILIGW